jgi:hypothetical protein
MSFEVPQYADFNLEFTDIQNSVDPTPIDLSAATDIVLAIAFASPTKTPVLILKNSEVPARFTIDNTAKSVKVSVLATEIGSKVGKFYTNLWVESNSKHLTHLTDSFDVKAAVKYSTT